MDYRLAGLATAYFLATAEATARDGQPLEFEVHLVDRVSVLSQALHFILRLTSRPQSKDIGMDTASLSVKTDEDDSFRVDVPMRSINGGKSPGPPLPVRTSPDDVRNYRLA